MSRRHHRSALSPRFHELLKAHRAVRGPFSIAHDTGLRHETVQRALCGHSLNPATRMVLELYLAGNDNGDAHA
jgi:DNA-binding phage protein